eukprot:gene23345-29558_t
MGTLGIGVKDLTDNILAVSMLKRENNQPGPGEEAGIRLGDIIFGINFVPTREGVGGVISSAQTTSLDIFSRVQMSHMIEDLKLRTSQPVASSAGISSSNIDETGHHVSSQSRVRAKQMQVLDLERNILQAKGLRTAMCVRIVHTKSHNDTVIYVLRVEDVESGLQWVVHRRYRDFFALNEELVDMSHFAKEAEFPRKRISIRNTAKLVENRIVALEQYARKMLHILTLYATMDSAASRSLRHLQNFLGVDRYVDCVHPPLVDDQRYIELMAYRFLNDFSSPACQQCVRFITTIDLDSIVETGPEGYRAVLTLVKDALTEVEQFVQQQHQQQMVQTLRDRRPDLDPEQLRSFVRKCIRRQVEAALYLPLRRNVFRIVYSFVAQKSKQMQRSMTLLQQATPNYLMVDSFVQQAKGLPNAVKAFRRVIQAYLPADQGQLLIEAAGTVTELHRECHVEKQRLRALEASRGGDGASAVTNAPPSLVVPSSSAPDNQVIVRTRSDTSQSSLAGPLDDGAKARKSVDRASRSRSSSVTIAANRLSGGGHDSPVANAAPTRRNSLSGFFRSKSSNLASPAASQIANTVNGTSNGTIEVDWIGKEALADPAGVMFHADETPDLYGTTKNHSSDDMPAGHFEDDTDEEAARVSFSVSVPGQTPVDCLTPPKRAMSIQRSTSGNAGLNHNNMLELITDYSSPMGGDSSSTAAEQRASGLHAFDARSQQNLDLLNIAIFDHQKSPLLSDGALQPGSVSGMALDVVEDGGGEATEKSLQRHKSVKLNSLLNDMLDLNMDDDKKDRSRDTSSAALDSGSLSAGRTNAQSEIATSDNQAVVQQQQQRLEKSLFEDIGEATSETAAVELEGSVIINNTTEVQQHDVISADDFLPLFTYVLVQAGLPQLLLVKELMVTLVDDEDAYGECGYYLATLEAATQHICDLADQYEKVAKVSDSLFDDGEDIFEHFDNK